LLSTFGIDATAESIYLSIVDNPMVDVAKLAEIMELSEAAVRTALDHLVELGLVTCDAAGDGCTAIEPEIGLATLLAQEQMELTRHQQQVEDTRLAVTQVLATHSQRKLRGPLGVEWIIGKSAVLERTRELAADCREEYLSLEPTGALPHGTLDGAGGINELLLSSSVEARSIVLDSIRNHKPALACLLREIEAGVHIRTLPTLPARIRIFDRRYATVSVSSITGIAGVLAVRCEAIVLSFVTLFFKLWAEAEPYKHRRSRRNGELSPQEKHLLKLWAQGHTDASAARQMDVSLRTVRRLSDRLTDRLKARSRFQLGAAAIAERLIDPADAF